MQQGPTAHSETAGNSARSRRPTHGEIVEARVAQVWFWEGFYARSGVNLQRHFYPDPLQVTDLDLLAFDFNPQLMRSKYIGEVKTGTSKAAPKPLDRIVWLCGLRALVEAESAELTIAHAPSAEVRAVGRGLGVVAQSIADFERRERDAVSALADYGAHGVAALELMFRVHEICRQDPELERAYWFLRSAVWFLEPFTAIKQLIDLLRRLKRRWTPNAEGVDGYAIRWLLAESGSVLTLNIVTIAGFSLTLDRAQFYELARQRLAEGAVPMPQMRQLSDSIDKFVAGILSTAQVPVEVRTQAIGAFLPQPPDFAEPLAEVAWRLARAPLAARSLPRQIDLLLHERVALWREIPENIAHRLGLNRPDATRNRTLVAAFLRGADAAASALDEALTEPIRTVRSSSHGDATTNPGPMVTPEEPTAVGQEQSTLFSEHVNGEQSDTS